MPPDRDWIPTTERRLIRVGGALRAARRCRPRAQVRLDVVQSMGAACRGGYATLSVVVTTRAVAMARIQKNRGIPDGKRAIRSFGNDRVCAARSCQTKLSRYNPDECCSIHQVQAPGRQPRRGDYP
jgi:hypothetical protein